MKKTSLALILFFCEISVFAQTPQDLIDKFSVKNSEDKVEVCEQFRPIISGLQNGTISSASGPALIKQLSEKISVYSYFMASCGDYSSTNEIVEKICKPEKAKVLSRNSEILCNLQKTGSASKFDNKFKLSVADSYLKAQKEGDSSIANDAKDQLSNLDKHFFSNSSTNANLTFEKTQNNQYGFTLEATGEPIRGTAAAQVLTVVSPKELSSCKIAYSVDSNLAFSTKKLEGGPACAVLVPDRGWVSFDKKCSADTEKSFVSSIFDMWAKKEFSKANYEIQDRVNACAAINSPYYFRLMLLKDVAKLTLSGKNANLCNADNNFEYPPSSYFGRTLKANSSLIEKAPLPDFWKNVKNVADSMCKQ